MDAEDWWISRTFGKRSRERLGKNTLLQGLKPIGFEGLAQGLKPLPPKEKSKKPQDPTLKLRGWGTHYALAKNAIIHIDSRGLPFE